MKSVDFHTVDLKMHIYMEHNYEFVMGDLEVMESVNYYAYTCVYLSLCIS